MTIPTFDALMNPMLSALRDLGGSGSIEELDTKTAEYAKLSDDVLSQPHDKDGGNQTEVAYRLAWARTYLKKYGLIDNSTRGVWSLTAKAKDVEEIDTQEVLRVVRAAMKTQPRPKPGKHEPELPDEERWRQDLLTIVTKNLSPAAFERLVQRVLRESGFTQVEVTGRSGDGGIDGRGIARIHGFMSFHVLFQCKRYQGSVSAGDIRDFRGAMVGRADKGLFITTGSFTPAAAREAIRDGAPPIDLVDGQELAEKLKELGLGVSKELVEKVSVDRTWFSGL